MHGIYTLIIEARDLSIRVGSLGTIHLDGIYAYVGSASKSLQHRIGRHLRRSKKVHWHIDYLTLNDNARVRYVVYAECKGYECTISKSIAERSINYVKGFGSSDCRCLSHLYLMHYSNISLAVELVKDAFIACNMQPREYDFNT